MKMIAKKQATDCINNGKILGTVFIFEIVFLK